MIWLVLACLLPGIFGATVLFTREYRESRAQLGKDTLQTARAMVHAVDNQILRAQAIAEGLATANSLQRGDFASFHARAREALEQSGLGADVVLADASGQELANTVRPFGTVLPHYDYPEMLASVFGTGRPAVSNLYTSRTLKRFTVAIAVPVFVRQRVTYALVIGILPEAFETTLRAQRLPPDWIAAILDGAGTFVARSAAGDRWRGKQVPPEFMNAIVASSEGTMDATTVEGTPAFSVFSRSPLTGWRVAIGIPLTVMESSLWQTLLAMLLGVLSLFAIGIAFAWFVAGRIGRSIQALVAPAAALGVGDNVKLPRIDVKEAGEVADAIARAAELLRQRTAALRESRSTLALALRAAGSAAWEMDVATERIVANDDVASGMLGFAADELPNRSDWVALIHDDDRDAVLAMIDDVVSGRKDGYSAELRMRAKDGNWHWILSQGVAAGRDAHGRALRLVGTHTDVTERREMQQRVRDAALHDPLTGLPNRALTFEYGSHLIAAARRSHGRGALLFVDLDRFKPVNDLYGHETGDRVLQEAAQRLLQCTRQEDMVGRIGGDEFVIILPHLDANHRRAAVVAEHVIAGIMRSFRVGSLEISISPSVGIAYFPEHAESIGALIHAADLAMYRAKQAGRAGYQFYTPDLDRQADAALSLESRLKEALRHGGLELHYQPVMDARSGRLIGAEALVRMPNGGGAREAGPQDFIPVAEAAGLIGPLGDWVAAEACRQHAAWQKEGLDVVIAINVSPLQFREKAFAARIGRIAADYGIEAAGLQIEVTESAIMENVDEAVRILQELKSHGMKIALDDFGTGYSNLGSLSRLPIDKLKVDQSFVRHIGDDARSRAIARAVIALGRALGLEIVAEGIESAETLGYLRGVGCDQVQGYFFSKPLPAAEFACWYRGHIMH
ncbi:MAG TPA: EAL domain-containing protein [Rhodocyclaceae bacterium]